MVNNVKNKLDSLFFTSHAWLAICDGASQIAAMADANLIFAPPRRDKRSGMGISMITTSKITTTDVKRYNKNRVFQLIYTAGKISRQEIADALQLSLPTVNQNLKLLFDMGLLSYEGSFESTGGRKAQIISVNGAARYTISVNLSDNGIKAAVLDLNCEVTGSMRVPAVFERGASYGETVADTVMRLVEHTGIDSNAVLGVGITVPGIFDMENSTVVYAPTMGMKNYPMENIARLLPFECRGMNDARSGAFAEFWFDRESHDKKEGKTYLMLNTGVGGSYIDSDNIRFGSHNRYGEFGHMTLYPGGRPCFCGKKGCFESYVSARCLSSDMGITLDTFFEGLRNGNEEYKKVFDKYLDDLTTGINNLYIMSDGDVIVGGPVAAYLREYKDLICRMLVEKCSFEIDGSYLSFAKCTQQQADSGAALIFLADFISSI